MTNIRQIAAVAILVLMPASLRGNSCEEDHLQRTSDRLNIASCLASHEQWAGAEQQLAVYSEAHPGSVTAALLEAHLLIHSNRFADGKELLDGLIAAHPDSVEALVLYASLCGKLGEPQQAEQLLVRCTRESPEDPEVWKRLGDFYLSQGSDRAWQCFRRAADLEPEDAQSWAGMGSASAQESDPKAAAREFQRAARLNRLAQKPNPMVDLLYGDFLRESDQYRSSIEEYNRALEADGGLLAARLERARSFIELREFGAAERDLGPCLRQPDTRLEALNLQLRVYRARRDPRATKCAAEIEKRSAEQVAEKARGNQIASQLRQASGLIHERKFAQAQKSYAELIRNHPEVAQAYLGLAESSYEGGDWASAESAARRSFAIEETTSGHVLLGRILLREKRIDAARIEFSRASNLDPLVVDARLGLAACEMLTNNYAGAIRILRKASELPVAEPEVHLMLTEAFYKNHEPAEARREVEELLAKDPDNATARRMKNQLLRTQ